MTDQLLTRGVLTGCLVAAEGTPSMNVAVAAGSILFDNAPATVAAVATLAITAAAPAASPASLTTALTGANNDLKFTSPNGTVGNATTVAYVDPGAASQPLTVTVGDQAIVVSLATDGGSAITSTGSAVLAAVNADLSASALVTATLAPANSGAGVVTAMAAAALTGGVDAKARWTLVVVDSAGAVTTIDGTPAVPDQAGTIPPPTWDPTKIALASVYVDAAVTTITTGAITDLRPFIDQPVRLNAQALGARGDGVTDDTAALAAAITVAAAIGAQVHLAPGTYITTGITLGAGAVFYGDGPASILKLKAATNHAVVSVAGDNVTIKDLQIDGNRANQTTDGYGIAASSGTHLQIQNVNITSCFLGGVYVSAAAGKSAVRECRITDVGWIGIYVQSPSAVSDITIRNNKIDRVAEGTGISGGGISVHGDLGVTSDIKIHGNHVDLPVSPSGAVIGIEVYGGITRATINGNTCAGGSNAVSLDTTQDGTVSGNTLYDFSYCGVELAGSTYSTVAGNAINGNNLTPNYGVITDASSAHNTVTGNSIRGCDDGVHANTGSDHLAVAGNHIATVARYCVNIAGSKYFAVTGNTLDCTGGGKKGVMLDNSYDGTVAGNVIYGCSETGVLFYCHTNGVTVDNIAVTGNMILNVNDWIDSDIAGGAALGNSIRVIGNNGDGTKDWWDWKNSTGVLHGAGSPASAVSAGVGSIYLRNDGGAVTSLYVKESGTGNTGWVAK